MNSLFLAGMNLGGCLSVGVTLKMELLGIQFVNDVDTFG